MKDLINFIGRRGEKPGMRINIIDTTLRDGEQKAGIALGINDKIRIAKILDHLGIYQIEAGTPAMGGEEKDSICKIVELGLKSKVSTWNRMNINDIQHSVDCNPDIIHMAVPSSDIQIKSKLNKDRSWIVEQLKRCTYFALSKGFEVTIGLEDASRADEKFLLKLIAVAFLEGVNRVRYADTVGIMHRQRVYKAFSGIKRELDVGLEIHAHNDFGMAVSNSVAAVKAGAEFVNCTIGGIGERAGNCDFIGFVTAAKTCLNEFRGFNMENTVKAQNEIMQIIHNEY